MSGNVTLHCYYRSSCSWRVRAALAFKGIKFEYRVVPLIGPKAGEVLRSDEYARDLNAMRQVPVLVVDGLALSQSVAICEFLDEHALWSDTPKLLPTDPALRAVARKFVEVINAGTQPLQNLSVLNAVEGFGGDKLVWARDAIAKGLAAYEADLARVPGRSDGDYTMGPELTLPDCFLVPQLYNAKRFEVDMAPFPRLQALEAKLAAHPAIVASHPDKQPDCPPPA